MCGEYFDNQITRFKIKQDKKVCHNCYNLESSIKNE